MAEQDPQSWVGRTESCDDNIDAGHIEKMAITLQAGIPEAGDVLPLLWHWGLFSKPVAYDGLGRDGHPVTGGFLPPAENRNRMWAGGRLRFLNPLLVGTPATRKSTILAINEKEGRSGRLTFVTVQHEITQDYVLCISEEQDIVYREPTPPKLEGSFAAPEAQWTETVEPSPVMLFRYSAVTFNGHRIHYDLDYVTREEGYPGLVVHGPLIATRMCRAFVHAHPDKKVTSLSYRGLRPLIAPAAFNVAGRLVAAGADDGENSESHGHAELWAEQGGTLAHQADITFDL